MLRTQLEILYFYIVDSLSSEYGWTIGYIQSLTMSEVIGLLGNIRDRKDSQDLITQMNVAKGMAGKISSNRATKEKDKKNTNEVKQLEQLARICGKKVKKIKK